jgi:uncharacterized protein YggU (UPF0235/DUF167 family)
MALTVRVTPQSGGWPRPRAIKIKLTAPPVEGAANAALIEWAADLLPIRLG